MKEIPLTQGKVALVDDCDFDEVMQFKWQAQKGTNTWYASRSIGSAPNRIDMPMHRAILKAPPSLDVDHKNGNGLDNRRENLRLATQSQNTANSFSRKQNKSGYKGVHWSPDTRKWRAQISRNGKKKHLGLFIDAKEAAAVYDAAAIELFGEFAYLNFPK